MPETVYSRYCLNLDGERWVILTNLDDCRWQVQLWGQEALHVNFLGLTVEEAKDHAIALVSLFLMDRCPDVHMPSSPEWRLLSSRTARRYKFQRYGPPQGLR